MIRRCSRCNFVFLGDADFVAHLADSRAKARMAEIVSAGAGRPDPQKPKCIPLAELREAGWYQWAAGPVWSPPMPGRFGSAGDFRPVA